MVGTSYLYHIGNWRKGETIDLEKSLLLDLLAQASQAGGSFQPTALDMALQVMGWRKSQGRSFGHMSGAVRGTGYGRGRPALSDAAVGLAAG